MQPTSNVNNFFGQKVSQPGIPVNQANDSQLLYKNDFSTTTYYDNEGNARVLLGLQPDGSYGMRVSLPGNDATSSTNLAFNSSQLTGTISVPGFVIAKEGSKRTGYTIAHNFGYTPPFSLFMNNPNNNVLDPSYFSDVLTPFAIPIPFQTTIELDVNADSSEIQVEFTYGADINNLYVQVDLSNGSTTNSYTSSAFTISYYIQEVAIVQS